MKNKEELEIMQLPLIPIYPLPTLWVYQNEEGLSESQKIVYKLYCIVSSWFNFQTSLAHIIPVHSLNRRPLQNRLYRGCQQSKAKKIKFVVLRADRRKNVVRLVGMMKINFSKFRDGNVQKNIFLNFIWMLHLMKLEMYSKVSKVLEIHSFVLINAVEYIFSHNAILPNIQCVIFTAVEIRFYYFFQFQ